MRGCEGIVMGVLKWGTFKTDAISPYIYNSPLLRPFGLTRLGELYMYGLMAGSVKVELYYSIRLENNELIFLDLQAGDIYQMISPQTGDMTNAGLWFVLLLVSSSMGIGVYLCNRKKWCEH